MSEWKDGDDSALYDKGYQHGYEVGDTHGYSAGYDACEQMWSDFTWKVIHFAIEQMDYDIEGGGRVNIEFLRELVVFLRQFPTDWDSLSDVLDNYIDHCVSNGHAEELYALMRMRLEPHKEEVE